MGFIEKRPGERGYRARYRDPLGEQRSKTFARKADAQRFLIEFRPTSLASGRAPSPSDRDRSTTSSVTPSGWSARSRPARRRKSTELGPRTEAYTSSR